MSSDIFRTPSTQAPAQPLSGRRDCSQTGQILRRALQKRASVFDALLLPTWANGARAEVIASTPKGRREFENCSCA